MSKKYALLAGFLLIGLSSGVVGAKAGPSSTQPPKELVRASSGKLGVSMIGHAHIDFAYLWAWPETVNVLQKTFSSVSGLMDEYPFVFSQSQAGLYAETKRVWPETYAKIRERVERGQWDVSTAGAWSEGDTNMSSGEAIVRSILLGKRFIKNEFGIEPSVGWAPDTFGHPWTLPQILAKSGTKFYYYSRGPGKPLFWWQSPDGSRVLAYRFGHYNSPVDREKIVSDAQEFQKQSGVSEYMRLYGVGDHGGGPTRAHLETITGMQAHMDYPSLLFSSAISYFEKVAKSGHSFPVVNSELNPVFTGCYTSHADIKRYNRECENSLASAEAISLIASDFGAPYPADQFGGSWRRTCFNQFHDILCGTAINEAYVFARQLRNEVVAQTTAAVNASVKALGSKIDTRGGGIPIVVYNPLAWTRTDFVNVQSPFAGQATAVKITDASGRAYAGRNLGNRLMFTARNVPAMGYKVFWVNRIDKPLGSNVAANGSVAENQFFRVQLEPHKGVIVGIYDKLNRRNVTLPGRYTGILQILSEDSRGMSAWTLGQIKGTKTLLDESEMVRVDTGPAKVTLQYDHRYGRSIFTQELTLYDAVPRIDIKLAADWREPWVKDKTTPMLKIAFPLNLGSSSATFEIPFGSIKRPKDGREAVGQKWADLSDSGYGVSILNDCKYGFDVTGNTMRMSLIRTPHKPDPQADLGMQEMTFSIYPHKGDWRSAGTVRRGYELNQPLIAVVAGAHEGTLPEEKSFLSVSAANLVVTALKKAEDDDGIIVRLYETNGEACQTRIRVGLAARAVVETDLMENPIGEPQSVTGGEFSTKVGKYEIKTYKILR